MGLTIDTAGTDNPSDLEQYIRRSRPQATGFGDYDSNTRARRAETARYAAQSAAYDRLNRSRAVTQLRQTASRSTTGTSLFEDQGRARQLGYLFRDWLNRSAAGQYSGQPQRAGYTSGSSATLPDWVTDAEAAEIRSFGTYRGQAIPGLGGTGIAATFREADGEVEGTEQEYLGVAHNWEQGYYAVRNTPQGWALVDAKYTLDSPQTELRRLSKNELDEYRGIFEAINARESFYGKAITSESFGLGYELNGEVDVMRYVMGFANENGMSWQQAAQLLAETSIEEINEGVYGLDGGPGGSGSAAEDLPPIESYTRTTFNLSDMDYARSVLTEIMRNKTGRQPNTQEVSKVLAAMNARERKNPTVEKEVFEYDENDREIGSKVTVTPDNVDRVGIAMDQARTPESRRFQEDMAMDVIAQLAGW